jgi:hypothetical protein
MPTSSKWPLTLTLSHQNSVYIYALPHTCYVPPDLILLDLFTWLTFGEENRAQSFSLRSLLHSPVTSPALAQISSSSHYHRTPSAYVSQYDRPSFTPIQENRKNCSAVYFNVKTILNSLEQNYQLQSLDKATTSYNIRTTADLGAKM